MAVGVAAQVEEGFAVQTQFWPEMAEVAVHQLHREDVMAGGYGRVGGEDRPFADFGLGVLERYALVDELAGALEEVERGVTFVGVPVGWLDAHGAQGADAADAEDDLLAHPVLTVATVEAGGDGAGPVRVAIDIRVEKVDGGAADLYLPDRDPQGGVHVVESDFDQDRGAGFVLHLDHRLAAALQVSGHVELPAVGVEALLEVALAIEERDADERQAQVAGLFDMVAGQHAEAA